MSDWQHAVIALGGNLGDAPATLCRAIKQLHAHPDIKVKALSALYRSDAIGPAGQPDYANAVASITTCLQPMALLRAVQHMENNAGRERLVRWGARTLDLDIVLYADLVLSRAELTIPHAEMCHRAFVLVPLSDVDPALILPNGQALSSLLAVLDKHGLSHWLDSRWQTLQQQITAGLT